MVELSREETEALVERLAKEFDERRQSDLGENRSKALESVLNSAKEYRFGSLEFRHTLSSRVWDRQVALGCERFAALGCKVVDIRPAVKYNGWQDDWENRRAG